MTSPAVLNFLTAGRAGAAPEKRVLTAGPWRVEFTEGELRYLTIGSTEAVRRIYAAIRDGNWNTIAARRSEESVVEKDGGFEISWLSEHLDGDVDFVWRSTITGTADGVIRWEFDGTARRAFAKNRIGFCLLHPLATCAGRPCEVEHVSGDIADRVFPAEIIDPNQPVRGLHDYRRMKYAVGEGVSLTMELEGDAFEMEDQRNWTDASFKTYSTPQRLPLPAKVREGQKIRQVITLRAEGTPLKSEAESGGVTLRLTGEKSALPAIGLGMTTLGRLMDDREAALLSALNLAHLRIDVKLSAADWRDTLSTAATEAARVGADLEIALHLPPAADAALLDELVAHSLTLAAPPARWLVLEEGRNVARPALLAAARHALAAGSAPVGAGTDQDFFPLNNDRPATDSADFIFTSMRPQAHAFDDATLVENLAGQEAMARSARLVFDPLPFVASPVTLKRRWHKGPPRPAHELPPMVDRRQASLLCAGWFAGSVRALAQNGAVSATWFETVGWRGVMESAAGAPLPDEFPSLPGAVFPVYHVLRALADFRGGDVLHSESAQPLTAQTLVVEKDGRRLWVIANFSAEALPVNLPVNAGVITVLDAPAALQHGANPEGLAAETRAWSDAALAVPAASVVFLRE